VSGTWRILHNEEFYHFYVPPNIMKVFESKFGGWARG